MPNFCDNPRSSDPIDFEHTATVKDIEELTLAEKVPSPSIRSLILLPLTFEQEYVSPKDGLPTIQRAEVAPSFSFPGTRPLEWHGTSTQTSRSNSRTSHTSSVSERILVFRDEEREPEEGGGVAAERKLTDLSRKLRNKVTQARYQTTGTEAASITAPLQYVDESHDPRALSEAAGALNTSQLTQQLQSIARRRLGLLRQLNDLQKEEANVLAQLMQSTIGFPEVPTSPRPQNSPHLLSPRPLNGLLNPKLTNIPSQLRRVQPSNPSRKPLHTRTASAPSVSTPSAMRHHTPSTSKRIPLSDKTEETLTSSGTALERNEEHYQSHALERGLRQTHEDNTLSSQWCATASQYTTTLRLPTKLGDALERFMPGTPRAKARSGSASSTRGRGTSKSRSRSRGRSRVTPIATPGITRSYDVPHTVARKKWDF
ncbi:hypothetical protein CC86DRAFT_401098 [Ophiobolus disseminans]|uniref:Uncharacterized protein n=1 Tax=Ophiobolus disseminans TaxID=1469910 RepID=A0A6A7AI35_9PLEO|nr:hypothetical protein CC86DRAFT_401098 [Ophiobolus disseminans]